MFNLSFYGNSTSLILILAIVFLRPVLTNLILTDLYKKAIALSRNITTELLSYNSFALGKTSSQLFSADALFKFEDKQTICNDCREEYRA